MQVGPVYHTGFTVSDIERSIVFYRDVLGLKLIKRQTGTAPYLATVTDSRACASKPRSSSRRRAAACWSFSSTSPPASATDRATNRPGNAHLCFKIDDLRSACAELQAPGRDAHLGAHGDHRGRSRGRLGGLPPRSGRLHRGALPGPIGEPGRRGGRRIGRGAPRIVSGGGAAPLAERVAGAIAWRLFVSAAYTTGLTLLIPFVVLRLQPEDLKLVPVGASPVCCGSPSD